MVGRGQPRLGTRTVVTLPDEWINDARRQAAARTAPGARVTPSDIYREWIAAGRAQAAASDED